MVKCFSIQTQCWEEDDDLQAKLVPSQGAMFLTRYKVNVPPYLRLAKAEFLQHNNPCYAPALDLPEKI